MKKEKGRKKGELAGSGFGRRSYATVGILRIHRGAKRGFTLIETVFAMLILLIGGLSAVTGVIYTRQSMELNKQQLAALHYARRTLERVGSLGHITGGVVSLVPFNAPGIEIEAVVDTRFYPFNSDGSVDWDSPVMIVDPANPEAHVTDLTPALPYLCCVTIEWTPSGSWSRPQAVSMQTVVRRGVL